MTLAIGICGYSGAGKTTLLQSIIPTLNNEGIRTAVVKHDSHELNIDHQGKDSDLLFRAGADVYLQSKNEIFLRKRPCCDMPLSETLRQLSPNYDLILLEGYKHSSIPKIWLLNEGKTHPPAECKNIIAILARDDDRHTQLYALIHEHLTQHHQKTKIYANILLGGKSTRMGQAKHLIPHPDHDSWLDHTLSILQPYCNEIIFTGDARTPDHLKHITHLPDPPNVKGPMSGILAGMRWAPEAAWIICACDMPMMTQSAIEWLMNERKVGNWGALPKRCEQSQVEPLFSFYGPQCAPLLEQAAISKRFKLNVLGEHSKIHCPIIPKHLLTAWSNMNTPADWKNVLKNN